jgi:TPR repeat protein
MLLWKWLETDKNIEKSFIWYLKSAEGGMQQ